MATKTFDLRGRKLFVAVPTYDHRISIKASISLAKLALLSAQEGVSMGIHPVSGSAIITTARNLLVDAFMRSEATDLLFLDSDINFEAQDALRLLALATDYPIIAGVPRMRKKDGSYLVSFYTKENSEDLVVNELGLMRANRVATAFMMINRRVFETLKADHPEWWHPHHQLEGGMHAYFDFALTPDGYMGEDFLFCERAKASGFEVWIDPTIKLGHVGTIEFEGDLKQSMLDAVKENPPAMLDSAA